jgi:hypothetical protein
VRVVQRVAHAGREPFDLVGLQPVLDPLGRSVPVAGTHTGPLGQVAFPDPVRPDDSQGIRAPLVGEGDVLVAEPDQVHLLHEAHDFDGTALRHADGSGQALHGARAASGLAGDQVLQPILESHPLVERDDSQQPRHHAKARPEGQDGQQRQRGEDQQRGCRIRNRTHRSNPLGRIGTRGGQNLALSPANGRTVGARSVSPRLTPQSS